MFWIRIAHLSKMIRTFHGKELAGFLLTHEKDFSNITPTEQLDLLEARRTNLNLVEKSSEKRVITNRVGNLTDLTLMELLEYVRRKATLFAPRTDGSFSETLGKVGVLTARGARLEDDADDTVSIELVPSPDVVWDADMPPLDPAAGAVAAGAKSPFLVATDDWREPRLKRPFAFGADATRLIRRDAVALTEREIRGRCPDGEGPGKKLLGTVDVAVAGGLCGSRDNNCRLTDFDLERCFASNDASGEGETRTEGGVWSGGVAGIFSLLESVELLDELDESRWEGEMREAGVSGWLGEDGLEEEERLVLRVKDEEMPLVESFLDDWLPIRNIDFHGLVGVDEPLRIARRLSVDLEWEKRPRVCIVGEGMEG
jgi:hypothetical protein